MKKTYTLFLAFIFGIFLVEGQVSAPPIDGTISQYIPTKGKKVINKTVNCVDTVRYPESKLTGIPETGAITYNASLWQGISQAYYLNTAATVLGIEAYLLLDFDGVPGNFAPVNAEIKVYNIDAQNYPTTLIGSAMVQVSDVGFQQQVLTFSAPIAVSDSFAIAIEMDSTFNVGSDTIYYATNVCQWNGGTGFCDVGDGNGEGLSCLSSPDFVSANGSGWFHNLIEVWNWDVDYLMSPIIEQDFTADFVSADDSLCLGQSVTVANTSILNTVPMFNQFGAGSPLYEWDFDDGMGPFNPFDTTYTYMNPGVYSPQLTINYYGYGVNCSESVSPVGLDFTVFDTNAVANFGFTDQGGGNFQFSDSSVAAYSYSWTFQSGVPSVSIAQNPTATFPSAGMYEVCLTITDTLGCVVDVFCDSVDFVVGIDDYYAADYVKVYPVPANKYFNVTVPSNYFNGKIVLTDVVGKELKSVSVDGNEKVKIGVEDMASGIYFVSIQHNGERVFTKRIVIDR